jgi:hypothetical protein
MHGNAKLTPADILLAVTLRQKTPPVTYRKLSNLLDVTPMTLMNAINGITASYARDDLMRSMNAARPGEHAIVEKRSKTGEVAIEVEHTYGYNEHDGTTVTIITPADNIR